MSHSPVARNSPETSADLDETHLFGEVPGKDASVGRFGHEVTHELSKLSLRSSSPDDYNDISSGIGSIVSSIVNIDNDEASGKNDKSNSDLFVALRKTPDTTRDANATEQHQNANQQPVVIDIENGEGKMRSRYAKMLCFIIVNCYMISFKI